MLAEFTRPLWSMTETMPAIYPWMMNRAELDTYCDSKSSSECNLAVVLEGAIRELQGEVSRITSEQESLRKSGDWFGAWEVGNERKRRQLEIAALQIGVSVLSWVDRRDRDEFLRMVGELPGKLTTLSLSRADPKRRHRRACIYSRPSSSRLSPADGGHCPGDHR
jgi:hypothetical protein